MLLPMAVLLSAFMESVWKTITYLWFCHLTHAHQPPYTYPSAPFLPADSVSGHLGVHFLGLPLPSKLCAAVQSTYGIASMARSAVLISRHAKAAEAHRAAMQDSEANAPA